MMTCSPLSKIGDGGNKNDDDDGDFNDDNGDVFNEAMVGVGDVHR